MTNNTATIMAIDPGESTGWAEAQLFWPSGRGVFNAQNPTRLTVLGHGHLAWKEFVVTLHERMQTNPFDYVVYESWRLRPDKAKEQIGSDMQSSQCIGAIKCVVWEAQRHGKDVVLHSQEPSIKKVINNMVPDKFWPRSDVEHNRDALRHLWYFVTNPNNGIGVLVPREDE